MDKYQYKARTLAQDSDIDEHSSIYGKRAGYTLRIAGLLHVAAIACGHIKHTKEISCETLSKAYGIVEHLQEYALSAHKRIQSSKDGDITRLSMESIQRNCKNRSQSAGYFRNRHCRNKQMRTLTNGRIERYMTLLVENGYGEWDTSYKDKGARRYKAYDREFIFEIDARNAVNLETVAHPDKEQVL